MVTKAQILSIDYQNNTCTLHVPLFENTKDDQVIVTATFAIAPGVFNGYVTGDIVYVAFENDIWHEPVVIGKLYLGANKEAEINHGAMYASDLKITSSACLPVNTKLNYDIDNSGIIISKSNKTYSSLSDLIKTIEKLDNSNSTVTFDTEGTADIKLAKYITINGEKKKLISDYSDIPNTPDIFTKTEVKGMFDNVDWQLEQVDKSINVWSDKTNTLITQVKALEIGTAAGFDEIKKETESAIEQGIGTIKLYCDEKISDQSGILTNYKTLIDQNTKNINLSAIAIENNSQNISQLNISANNIKSQVTSISKDLKQTQSIIDQTAENIRMEVSEGYVKGNDFNIDNTFGWNMTTDGVNFYDEDRDVLTINDQGINVAGKIEAESGHIGIVYDRIDKCEYRDFFYDSEIWELDNIPTDTISPRFKAKSNIGLSLSIAQEAYDDGINYRQWPELENHDYFIANITDPNDEYFQPIFIKINIDDLFDEQYYTVVEDEDDYKYILNTSYCKTTTKTNKIIKIIENARDGNYLATLNTINYNVYFDTDEYILTFINPNTEDEFEIKAENFTEVVTPNSTGVLFEERWEKTSDTDSIVTYTCNNDEARQLKFTINDPNDPDVVLLKYDEKIVNCNDFSIQRYSLGKITLGASDENSGFIIGNNNIHRIKFTIADISNEGIYLGTDGINLGKATSDKCNIKILEDPGNIQITSLFSSFGSENLPMTIGRYDINYYDTERNVLGVKIPNYYLSQNLDVSLDNLNGLKTFQMILTGARASEGSEIQTYDGEGDWQFYLGKWRSHYKGLLTNRWVYTEGIEFDKREVSYWTPEGREGEKTTWKDIITGANKLTTSNAMAVLDDSSRVYGSTTEAISSGAWSNAINLSAYFKNISAVTASIYNYEGAAGITKQGDTSVKWNGTTIYVRNNTNESHQISYIVYGERK